MQFHIKLICLSDIIHRNSQRKSDAAFNSFYYKEVIFSMTEVSIMLDSIVFKIKKFLYYDWSFNSYQILYSAISQMVKTITNNK
jgi:hypothetical protein